MDVKIRLAVPADAAACGRIMYEAFQGINEQHGFENVEIRSAEVGGRVAAYLIPNPSFYGLVAEVGECIVGSGFLDERSSIRGVNLLTVDPASQGQGMGRKLLEALLERCRTSRGVRLVQHTFNVSSLALYASLGFEVKEPLLLMRGPIGGKRSGDVDVRPMHRRDLDACGALCEQVYGLTRTNEVRDGLDALSPFVAVRAGRVVAYASAPHSWSANHAVSETEDDMRALLLGIGASTTDPLSFLLPIRQAGLFRWCLDQGLRAIKPMTLMSVGEYQEPAGCYITSVAF